MTWNWRQRRRRLLLGAAVLACALAVVRPPVAHAGYPLAGAAPIALGFGSTYRSAEATTSSTHRGADLSAEAGARVIAPLSGTVTFAGRVPAVGGGTVRAVTLSTAQGAITLLPLEGVSVARGSAVAEGDPVGTVASAGDGSSSETHLHVGVKRGGLYIDPLSVLTLPVAAPADAAAGEGAGAGAGATRGVHAGAGASAAGDAAARSLARGQAPATLSAPVRATLRAAVPGAVLAPGVTIAGASPAAAVTEAGAVAARVAGGVATLPAPSVHAQPLRSAPLTVAQVASRLAGVAASGLRLLALGVLGCLGGVALLWPMWRRGAQKGTGEDRVSALKDDVAAAVGQ
jgi:hypothetical protein